MTETEGEGTPAGSAPAFKILVIDDDVRVLETVAELLGDDGYDVITASSGPQGLELARSQRPHLVLADLNMPRLNGAETVRRLKADPVTQHIPVLAMTTTMDADRMMEAGCVGYIPKPLDARELPGLVARFLKATVLGRKT